MNTAPVPLYIRVSHEDQVQGSGLPIQLRDCKAAAEREGFAHGEVFAEEGESAKTADRPQFLKLMDFIREHRPPAVVVWKLDRLARNSLDSQLFRAKLKEYGTRLISATEAIPDDYSGKLFADIISAIAEYDNSLRAERSRNGMVWRAQQGYWVNSPPLGYQAARTHDDKPTLEPDEKAPLVLELFRLVADGSSQADARAVVTHKGLRSRTGKPLTKQAVSNMLSNAAYAGIMNGKLVPVPIPGKWPAIVPQDIFDAVQVRLRRGTQTRRDSMDFPLRGLLACPNCESMLTASYSKGNGGSYAYYHCHGCNGVRVRREEAEEAVTALIDGLAVEEDMLDYMETLLARTMKAYFDPARKEKEKMRRKLIGLEERMDRLVELRLSGKIDSERYEEKYSDLEDRLLHARHDYNIADKEKIDLLEEFKQARCLLNNPGRFWRTASTPERHTVFPLLFDKPLTVMADKKAGTLRLEGSNCQIWLSITDRFLTDVKQIAPWLEAHHAFRLARAAA